MKIFIDFYTTSFVFLEKLALHKPGNIINNNNTTTQEHNSTTTSRKSRESTLSINFLI